MLMTNPAIRYVRGELVSESEVVKACRRFGTTVFAQLKRRLLETKIRSEKKLSRRRGRS